MLQKRVLGFIVLFFLIASVSAFSFGDFFKDLLSSPTGKVIDEGLPDPKLYYKLDSSTPNTGTEGAKFTDSSGNGYTGSCNLNARCPTLVEGATSFDGLDNILNPLSLPKQQGAISHWIKPSEAKQRVILYESDGTTANYDGFGIGAAGGLEIHTALLADGKAYFTIQDGSVSKSVSGGNVPVNTWSHYLVTWNRAGDMVLYVNGVEVGRTTISGTNFESRAASNRRIGTLVGSTSTRNWVGSISDLRIYDKELSASEVSKLYGYGRNGASKGGSPGPVCGNGNVEAGEVCDGGSQVCTTNGYSGSQSCKSDCSGYNSCSTTLSCGDGIINGNEVCDGSNLNGKTCITQGYNAGTLSCNSNCASYNVNSCTNVTAPVYTCTDSDGGLNYNVRGNTTGYSLCSSPNGTIYPCNYGINYDGCLYNSKSNTYILSEEICTSDGFASSESYDCPNGCVAGACLNASIPFEPACTELIDYVNGLEDYTDSDGREWFVYNYTDRYEEYFGGLIVNVTSYISFIKNYDSENDIWYDYSYNVRVYDDPSIDLNKYILEAFSYCAPDYMRSGNGQENIFWICSHSYDSAVSNPGQSYGNEQFSAIWFKDNVLVTLEFGSGGKLSDAEIAKVASQTLNEFVNSLKDNYFDYSNEGFTWRSLVPDNIQSSFESRLESALNLCPSEVSIGPGEFSYEYRCMTEPVVCPEYGYQNKICMEVDFATGQEKTTTTSQYCNPGICSGCYVPRWVGSLDNTCVPYGIRFLNSIENAEAETIYEQFSSDEYYLKVNSETSATLILYGRYYNNTYELIEGQEIYIVFPDWDDGFNEMKMKVKNIVPSLTSGEGYIEVDFLEIESFNAYCDYDGMVKGQKGDDAECNNDYECFSGECNSGICVNTYTAVAGQTNILLRILCRLSNLPILGGTEEDYQQCIASGASGA